MGCKRLTYNDFSATLKLVHGDFSMIPKSCAGAYRYGFNGMEADDEVKGEGNSYTTEFRQYDPRLGRWLSLDPLFQNFPWQSPYVAFDNNPIVNNDPRGLAAESTNDVGDKKGKLQSKRDRLKTKLFKTPRDRQNKKDRLDNKIDRIDNKLIRLGKKSMSEPGNSPNANYGRGGGDNSVGGASGNITETLWNAGGSPPETELGYRAGTTDANGDIQIIQIGTPVTVSGEIVPQWPVGNTYSQSVGTNVQVDQNGNIMDNNDPSGTTILIPTIGAIPGDALYKTGETVQRAEGSLKRTTLNVANNDQIVRYYIKQTMTTSGIVTNTENIEKQISNTNNLPNDANVIFRGR
jgi:RHS repeat-associated protein